MARTPTETIEKIRELYDKGIRRWEICKKLGVSNWLIQYYTKDMPRQVKKLTTEEKEEIRKLFSEGKDILELTKKFGIHRQTIYLLTYDLRGSVRRLALVQLWRYFLS